MRGTLFADVLKVADGRDWKQVVVELAEKSPEVVAKVIAGHYEKDVWKSEVRRKCPAGKVPAIKLMRQHTGAGLLEAKQWVEGDNECCSVGGWNVVTMPDDNPYK